MADALVRGARKGHVEAAGEEEFALEDSELARTFRRALRRRVKGRTSRNGWMATIARRLENAALGDAHDQGPSSTLKKLDLQSNHIGNAAAPLGEWPDCTSTGTRSATRGFRRRPRKRRGARASQPLCEPASTPRRAAPTPKLRLAAQKR